jgi:hypothetical protein
MRKSACSDSTVVEGLTHDSKIEGSYPATSTGMENMALNRKFKITQQR